MSRYPCPCCGHLTLPEPAGSFEICPVCFWQDDPVDNEDTEVTGPNHLRLSVARDNFRRIGAAEARVVPFVRPPRPDEIQQP
jgi:Cysteine-rich CPCC